MPDWVGIGAVISAIVMGGVTLYREIRHQQRSDTATTATLTNEQKAAEAVRDKESRADAIKEWVTYARRLEKRLEDQEKANSVILDRERTSQIEAAELRVVNRGLQEEVRELRESIHGSEGG